MKKFVLIGAAGYIAERHLRAIKETGNELVAAMDICDIVGRLDSYFPDAKFFKSLRDLENFICLLPGRIDYLVICTPNYLHLDYILWGLDFGMDIICEKPLVIKPFDLNRIKTYETISGRKTNVILQLRLHPELIKLKQYIQHNPGENFTVKLVYITPRGDWFLKSWKGDAIESGGITLNIGVHMFDLLTWLFGPFVKSLSDEVTDKIAKGKLMLENAFVDWFLSIRKDDLPNPEEIKAFRLLIVNGNEIELNLNFTDLHTKSYKQILAGNGFGVEDARAGIDIGYYFRKKLVSGEPDEISFIPFKI